MAYNYLRLPYVIMAKETNILVFKSIFSEREIRISDIVSIKTSFGNGYFRHTNGKVTMINRIDNLHELISEIKKTNKSLVTKGC